MCSTIPLIVVLARMTSGPSPVFDNSINSCVSKDDFSGQNL